MNVSSNFFERIMQIANYYGFKNPNDFAKNALNYKSSEKISRLKDSNKKPSIDILLDITNKFEEVSAAWLLTGKGQMLRQLQNEHQLVEEPSSLYSIQNLNTDQYNLLLAEKDAEIKRLMKIIEMLARNDTNDL